jgi:hypothetical protein
MENQMKKADYRVIGNAGIAAGVGFVLLAIFLVFTTMRVNVDRDFWGNVRSVSYSFPNAPYSIGLGAAGILSAAIGSAYHIRGKEEKPELPPPP